MAFSDKSEMTDLQILINGEAADIGSTDQFKITIHRVIFDFQNPTSQGGDHTYQVIFPSTKHNDRLFGPHLIDTQTTKKFVRVESMSVKIIVNGKLIFSGKPLIQSAQGKGGYAVTLFSDNIGWATNLQNTRLRDTVLPQIAYAGARLYGAVIEPVDAVTTRDFDLLTCDETVITFPLVAYGNYFQSGGGQYGLLASRVQDIGWEEQAPCSFVVPVIRAMIKQAGYSMAGGWFDTEEACKHFSAYVGDTAPKWNWGFLARVKVSDLFYTYHQDVFTTNNWQYQIGRGIIWIAQTTILNWDYSDSFFQSSPDEEYITPITGEYRFQIDTGNITLVKDISGTFVVPPPYDHLRQAVAIVIVPDDSDELLGLQTSLTDYMGDGTVTVVSDENIIAFYDFGTGYEESPYTLLPFTTGGTYSQIQTAPIGTPGAQVQGIGNVTIEIENVQLPQGTRVSVWLVSQFGQSDPVLVQDINFAGFELDVKETSYSDLLNPADMLPDVTQFDFLKGIITAFNLCFSVDAAKRVIRFDTRDAFYRDNQFALDWSHLTSVIDTPSRPVPSYSKTIFLWEVDGNDFLLQTFGTEQFEYRDSNDSIYALQSTEEITVPFSPTYEREYQFKGLGGGAPLISRVIIPCIASEAQFQTIQDEIEWDYNYRPRLLKSIGMVAGYWKFDGVVYSEYPAARFSFDETGGKSLSFGEGSGRLIRNGGPLVTGDQNEGLYKWLWRKFMALRKNGHIQEVSVNLDENDFAIADVSIPIVINGIHYWAYAYIDGFDPTNIRPMRIDLIRQV